MSIEIFSKIRDAYHTWSRNVDDKGYQQFYYARNGKGLKAMSNMELSMSVKLGKTEIAILGFMAVIIYLSVNAPKSTVQEATPQPPRLKPTAGSKIQTLPSVDTVVFPPESTIDTLNWDCRTISKLYGTAYSAALAAENPKIVEKPPYKIIYNNGVEEVLQQLPHIVHNGEEICVVEQ